MWFGVFQGISKFFLSNFFLFISKVTNVSVESINNFHNKKGGQEVITPKRHRVVCLGDK